MVKKTLISLLGEACESLKPKVPKFIELCYCKQRVCGSLAYLTTSHSVQRKVNPCIIQIETFQETALKSKMQIKNYAKKTCTFVFHFACRLCGSACL